MTRRDMKLQFSDRFILDNIIEFHMQTENIPGKTSSLIPIGITFHAGIMVPQHMINVTITPGAGKSILESHSVKQAVVDVESMLGSRGRVVLRPSGTEPLMRVMIEADDIDLVVRLTEQLASVIRDYSDRLKGAAN